MEIFKTVANGEDIELGKHVARAIANASAHNQNGLFLLRKYLFFKRLYMKYFIKLE